MSKSRTKLPISCDSTKCENGLHCFRATKEMIDQNRAGVCISCGAAPIDWLRLHGRSIGDAAHTLESLKQEYVRYYFWNIELKQRPINHARRKGKIGIRAAIRRQLETSIAAAKPFHDGFQTPMPVPDEATTVYPYAQHATATCCRKCLEYWHGIPRGRQLTADELDYLSELVFCYVEERVPEMTDQGEYIPAVRKHENL